jgi:uncharacterized phage infection (PIP) family protein YhgE
MKTLGVIFLSSLSILLLINLLSPDFDASKFGIGFFTGFFIGVLAAVIPASLNIVGSGLNPSGTWLIVAFAALISLLFGASFSVAGIEINLGGNLVGTAINTLQSMPHGAVFVYVLASITIVSGVMLVLSRGA